MGLSECSSISGFSSSSSLETPIPCSVTSSFQTLSDLDADVQNIEPYVPFEHKPDIDLIKTTPHCDDTSVHPAIAALTNEQSFELLNAPIWNASAHKEEEEKDVHYSKIALDDEDDYQYILHPNKAPIKYGYAQAQSSSSKVAPDDTFIYPPHIQYMQQYEEHGGFYQLHEESGETFDAFADELVVALETHAPVPCTAKSTHSVNSMHSSTRTSNIASPSSPPIHTNALSYQTNTSQKNLYETRASRIASEGSNNETKIAAVGAPNVATANHSGLLSTNGMSLYGEPRIAAPADLKISYIFCRN